MKKVLALLGLFYAAGIWGTTFSLVKDALEWLDPNLLIAYRFLLAAAVMVPILVLRRQSPLRQWRSGLWLGVALWAVFLPQTIGLVHTSAANAAFITGLFVVFVPLLAVVLDRKVPARRDALAILLALVGLWVLTGGVEGMRFGESLTLITAVAIAVHLYLSNRYLRSEHDPYVLCFQQLAVTGTLGALTAGALGISFPVPTFGQFQSIAFLALFPSVFALMAQFYGQRLVSPIKVSLIFSLEPVVAGIFAWTIGGEAFHPLRASGGLMIFVAMLVSELPWAVWKGPIFSSEAPALNQM